MRSRTKEVVIIGMFAAILAVISQISVPIPNGIPITFQVFAVVFMGAVLGVKRGITALAVYILVGVVGVPVFAGFKGGVQALVQLTGGFIWGFIPLIVLSGLAVKFSLGGKHIVLSYIVSFIGLILCHICGIIQFAVVSEQGIWESLLLVCLPYLWKDIILMGAGLFVGRNIRQRLIRHSLL